MTSAPRLGGPLARRLRLDLAYDGGAFHGWSVQPGLRTVQGVVDEVLRRHPVGDLVAGPATCAGRTDSGVHARGQVAHVDLYRSLEPPEAPEALEPPQPPEPPEGADSPPDAEPAPDEDLARAARRWARALPPDVGLLQARVVPADFDARFSALWRRYVYRISDPLTCYDPLTRGFVLRHPRPLDPVAMSAAGAALLGEHDFAAYCRRKPDATTIRTLLECTTARAASGIVEVSVRADAFCQQMVRSIVGALLGVGEGARDPGWPSLLLADLVRAPGVQVAPAHGLCLTEVGYPAPAQFATRTRATRAVRTLPAPDRTAAEVGAPAVAP